MERSATDRVGNVAALVIVLIVNGLASGLPLGGQTTGQVSAKYPSLFTPAGFTFAIWGIIYLSLIAFVIYQALPGQRNSQTIAKITPLFVVNCMSNAAWIFAWHYDFLWLSLLLMVVTLLTLVQIYRLLSAAGEPDSITEWLCLRLPFALYTGWITVATIANISVLQTANGWDDAGLSAVDWTLLKLAMRVQKRHQPRFTIKLLLSVPGKFRQCRSQSDS